MDKKAILGMGMINIVAMIVFVIALIVFFILFRYNVNFMGGLSVDSVSNSNILLLNYLRTPYEEGVIVDLVVTSFENDEYEKLDSFTQEIFKNSNLCFKLFINNKGINVCPAKDSGKRFRDFRVEGLRYEGTIFIPTKDKELVKVKIVELKEYYE